MGSAKDVSKMSDLFSDLGFTSMISEDLTRKDMRNKLDEFANDPRHVYSEMMILIIMSHGSLGKIQCTDGKEVSQFRANLFYKVCQKCSTNTLKLFAV